MTLLLLLVRLVPYTDYRSSAVKFASAPLWLGRRRYYIFFGVFVYTVTNRIKFCNSVVGNVIISYYSRFSR